MPGRNSRLLPLGILVLSMAGLSLAQINGVPASVSSFGFGGHFSSSPGVPASVTSLGPNGFGNSPAVFGNCCFGNFSFRGGKHTPIFSGRRHALPQGFFPAVIPYAVPYTQVVVVPQAVVYDDDAAEDNDGAILDRRVSRRSRLRDRIVEEEPAPAAPAQVAMAPSLPVAAQPSTLLIYRDGHQAEVQNYAIVGDTLFNFSDDRSFRILLAELDLNATQKANADRGVDFRLPPGQ